MKAYRLFIALPFIFLLSTCNLQELNEDPGAITSADMTLILPGASIQAAYNSMGEVSRLAGIVVQHWDGLEAQQEAFTNYSISENEASEAWNSGFYAGVLKDTYLIREEAIKENNRYYVGIANVLTAQSLGLLTSAWGDIPYSQAFQPEKYPQPAYDTQEAVYDAIQALLASALVEFELDEYESPIPPGADDPFLGGDIPSWRAVVRTFQARYYLHTIRRNEGNAKLALDALNAGSLIAEEVDGDDITEPTLSFSGNLRNPLSNFHLERPATLGIGKSFAKRLAGDPRADFIFDGTNFADSDNDNLYWSQTDTSLPFISRTEAFFLYAEALLRVAGGTVTDGVREAFFDGIISNLNIYEIDLTSDDARTLIRTQTEALDAVANLNDGLEVIINQKYIALYGQAPMEAWVDYRRTGFPALTPSKNNAASLNPLVDGKIQIPQRFLYPIDERLTNGPNRDAAIANQGGHLMNQRLWAFKPNP